MNITKEECFEILNKHLKEDASIFWSNTFKTVDLNRFTTSFQFYSFKDKLTQYYLTSNGICFGNALEEIVHLFLEKNGAEFLDRRHVVENHDCDQIFKYNDKIVLIEQKVRDDHDSTKKVGQVQNFQTKKQTLQNNYEKVYCAFWFIDDCFHKNHKYYSDNLTEQYELCYGAEIEDFLELIFDDNRATGFIETLTSYIEEYRNSACSADIFNDVLIDYTTIPAAKLFTILNEKKYKNEIAYYFFQNNIPYNEILNFYRKKRKSEYVNKIIALLEEKLNEQTI